MTMTEDPFSHISQIGSSLLGNMALIIMLPVVVAITAIVTAYFAFKEGDDVEPESIVQPIIIVVATTLLSVVVVLIVNHLITTFS